jgi:hypothetical protein
MEYLQNKPMSKLQQHNYSPVNEYLYIWDNEITSNNYCNNVAKYM